MTETIYTNYWVNRRVDVKKEHGSYSSEEEALKGIKAWWAIHGENHDYEEVRTNTGALEILYGDPNYFYRIEKDPSIDKLAKTSYRVKSPGEIDALRKKYSLDSERYLFDELAEPYRDRIILAMNDIKKARAYCYTKKGSPIIKLGER